MLNETQTGIPEIRLSEGNSGSPISYADSLENYRKNTDWWIVFDCLDLPNAIGSALWIAGRTGLSVETANEALEGLVVLGLLKKSQNGYEKVTLNFDVPSENQTKAQRMAEHALISRQILNHLHEEARGAIRFGSFASNVQIIADLYEKIDKAIYEAQEKSRKLSKQELDNVYLVSYTSITALPNSQNGKGAAHV